jgi:phosphatidylglycerophosphatase GEP4
LYSSQHQTHSKNICSLALHPTSNCKRNGKEQKNSQTNNNKGYPDPDQNLSVFDRFQCSLDTNTNANQNPETENQEIEETGDTETGNQRGPLSNMWWTDLRAALGQRINVEGIVSSASVFVKDRHLALPHVVVPDIRYIDWGGLQARGFKGVVFDKDNTITVPYSLTLWGPLSPSIERCKSVFGNDIAVFSNSAGNFGKTLLQL